MQEARDLWVFTREIRSPGVLHTEMRAVRYRARRLRYSTGGGMLRAAELSLRDVTGLPMT